MSNGQTVQEILQRRDEAVVILREKAVFGEEKLRILDSRIGSSEAEAARMTARASVPRSALAPLDALKAQRDSLAAMVELLHLRAAIVDLQAANAAWDAQETQDALAKMKSIVKRMNQTAARMVTTAQFISSANVLAKTASEIESVLVDP